MREKRGRWSQKTPLWGWYVLPSLHGVCGLTSGCLPLKASAFTCCHLTDDSYNCSVMELGGNEDSLRITSGVIQENEDLAPFQLCISTVGRNFLLETQKPFGDVVGVNLEPQLAHAKNTQLSYIYKLHTYTLQIHHHTALFPAMRSLATCGFSRPHGSVLSSFHLLFLHFPLSTGLPLSLLSSHSETSNPTFPFHCPITGSSLYLTS